MYSFLIEFYAQMVRDGEMTLEEIDPYWREDVRKMLEGGAG